MTGTAPARGTARAEDPVLADARTPEDGTSLTDGTVPADGTSLTDGTVLGDGTTARSRAGARWRRWRWPLALGVGILVAAAVGLVVRPSTSTEPFAPDNPGGTGARALAQVLTAQGVDVTYVRTTADAVAAAGPDTTLLVAGTWFLDDAQVERIAATRADLVLAEPEWSHLGTLTHDALRLGTSIRPGPRDAACDDPDARAAGQVRSQGYGLVADGPGVVVCFPDGDAAGAGSYAVLQDGGRRVVVVDDLGLLSNDRLDQDGTAALMLRALGKHPTLVWYLPSPTVAADLPGSGLPLPPGTGLVAAHLVLVLIALAVWRGRALGRVVVEPLPVTVRAAETTVGRGRLYRRSRSRGHAAAALRAGTAARTAQRVGLPGSAGATEVVEALSRATGRDPHQVAHLLYGPPPTDDAGLLQLARALDELESEVHRT